MITNIEFSNAKEMIDSVPDVVVVDVREEEEYILGHIENAVLLPVDSINQVTACDVIPSLETPLIVYCKTGNKAIQASYKLSEVGYTNIFNLGGLVGWPYNLEY